MNKNRSLAAAVFLLCVFSLSPLQAQDIPNGCFSFPDSAYQAPAYRTRDTLRGVAIWASSSTNARGTKLPTFWRKVWDANEQVSLPRFYEDNSDSAGVPRHILNVDVFGAEDSSCFIGGTYAGGCDAGFVTAVLDAADDTIDFRNYDRDGDKWVDALFFCVNDTSYYSGGHFFKGQADLCFSDTFFTDDSVGTVPIKISYSSGLIAYTVNREDLVSTLAHEWGHKMTNRGLKEYYAPFSASWWVTGSFTTMGFGGFQYRASPFHPFQNHRFIGWDPPVDITNTTYNQQIDPYFSSVKKSYRIKKNNTEYFEVSYHINDPNTGAFWEREWPATGLLIAHIREDQTNPLAKGPKQIDLELPHPGGLRDTCLDRPGCAYGFLSSQNDSMGYDSLDLFYPYIDTLNFGGNIGSATCLWNADTKQYFDDKTNPSSRVYGTVGQNAFSKLAVENIQINGATASADFIINAQYGRISSNTTWGPGLVSVIGDVTVDSAVTLTIQPGTTLKFQKNYDNMKSGNDTLKSRFIVKGTLTCLGTLSDSIFLTSSATTPSNGDWGGILVAFPGRANIEFTRFSFADTAIVVTGDTATVKVRNSTFTHFNTMAVHSKSNRTNLGVYASQDCGKNNIFMKTATSGAVAVTKTATPVIALYADGNWWDSTAPPASWFVGPMHHLPHLQGKATPDSCPPGGGGGGGCDGPACRVVVDAPRPMVYSLSQNYPNPFNPATVIRYAIPEAARVELRIYNILGQPVRTLVNTELAAGVYESLWEGEDESGRKVSSGTYFYQIRAGTFIQAKKMQLVK